MNEYTPTTENIRQTFAYVRAGLDHDDGYPFVMEFHVEAFGRWLAEVKAQAVAEDRAQLLDIAKGNLQGCSGYGCDECESVMFIDDIVVQRQIRSGEEK